MLIKKFLEKKLWNEREMQNSGHHEKKSGASPGGGFTLIEMIVTLLIVGLMAAIGGMGIVQAVRGYVTVRENAAITQKAQLAMSRITREIQEMMSVAPGTTGGDTEVLRMIGTANCASSGNCFRMIGRPASGSTENVRNTLRIVFGNGAMPSGDILIDNVTNFQFTYYSANVPYTSWAPGDDMHLSGIGVNMTVTNSNGQALSFHSLINPRNNGNLGGANMPVAVPAGTPAVWNVSNCFVATAAYGDARHPMVQILRDFRDRELIHWPGGKSLIHFYEKNGPKAADIIRDRPAAMWAVRCLLAPVVAFAFCMMYAPLAIPFVLFASIIITLAASSVFRRKPIRVPAVLRQRGSILVGIIITMVVIAVLAAAMIPIFSSSYMNQVHADQGRKAYFLAESGYHYATGRFLWAGTELARDTVISDLDGKTVNLPENTGSFTTQVLPFWLKVNTLINGSTSLTADYIARLPAELSGACSGTPCGYLQVGSDFYSYNSRNVSSGSVTFTGLSPAATKTYSAGQMVSPVAKTGSAQTLGSSGGSLTLSANGYNALPEYNGIFSFQPAPSGLTGGSVQFNYKYRKDNVLYNITRADKKTWTSLTVAAGTNIILDRFIRISSTGRTAGGSVRSVDYDTSLSWFYGAGGFHYKEDSIDTIGKMIIKPGKNTVTDTINVIGMDDKNTLADYGWLGLILQFILIDIPNTIYNWIFGDCPQPNPQINFVGANVTQLNVNPAQSWLDAQGFLSYDIQAKVEANGQPSFFAGPTFRGRNVTVNGRNVMASYGVSFAKASHNWYSSVRRGCYACFPVDQIGSFFPGVQETPIWQWCDPTCNCGLEGSGSSGCTGVSHQNLEYSLPAIILWKIGNDGIIQWLAYKILDTNDGIVSYNSTTKAWRLNPDYSTLLVRVAEGYAITFTGGSSEIKKNDFISNAAGTRRARVVMTPILTSGTWAGGDAAGTLVVTNVNNGTSGATFSSGALYKGATQVATATGFDSTKKNYIRVYFSHSGPADQGTPNNLETDNNRHANQVGQHNWPPDSLTDLAASNDYFTLVQWTATNTDTLGTEMMSNPMSGWTFNNGWLGGPWSYSGGGIQLGVCSYSTRTATSPNIAVTAGVTYDVTINISNTGGLLNLPGYGFYVNFGCYQEHIPMQAFNGNYTLSFKPTTTGNIQIIITPDSETCSFRINSISVKPHISGAMSSTSEPKAIIRDNSLTSPTPSCMTGDSTQFTCTASDFAFGTYYGDSFGLLTIGATGPNISYDDWWIRMEERKGTSLYPPIQH